MKKYELLKDDTIQLANKTLYRIKAIKNFGGIKAGTLGGYIQSEDNLSHDGNAWVRDNAVVCDKAIVRDSAVICCDAEIRDNAVIRDNAWICNNARICDNAIIRDSAWICNNARIRDNAIIRDSAMIRGNAEICDNAIIRDSAMIRGNARICGKRDYIYFRGFGSEYRHTTMYRTDVEICVSCGCFHSTLDEFAAQVAKKHFDNKFAKEYELCIELAKLHFYEEE